MDITMCTAEGCDKKENCLRFKGKRNEFKQSIFTSPPFVIHNGMQFCQHFLKFKQNNKDDKGNS